MLEDVFPPASTEPAPKNRLPLPSPSTAVLSGWSGLQLQWPPEPSPGLILLRHLPGPATSLLRAHLTPHLQDKTHTPHMNPLTPPTPHCLPDQILILQPCVQGPSPPGGERWTHMFLRTKRTERPKVWGRLATRSFSHGQRVGLQRNTSSLWVCRSIYSNR